MSNTISKFAIAAVLAGGLFIPSHAQAQSRKVDSSHSEAWLSIDGTIGSTNQTITLGAARISGTVNLDKDNLTQSTFAFSIYPAGSLSASIDPNGTSTSGEGSESANYTLVSFQSERVSMTSDGNLKVIGKLTTTSVKYEADLTLSEAYAGATCTGDALQLAARLITYPGTGEDYPGPDMASAQLGNKLTILVHLQLTEEQPQLSAKADE